MNMEKGVSKKVSGLRVNRGGRRVSKGDKEGLSLFLLLGLFLFSAISVSAINVNFTQSSTENDSNQKNVDVGLNVTDSNGDYYTLTDVNESLGLWLRFENSNFIDYSSYNHSIVGTDSQSSINLTYGGAANISNTNLTISSDNSLQPSGYGMTICSSFKTNGYVDNVCTVVAKYNYATNERGYVILIDDSEIRFITSSDGTAGTASTVIANDNFVDDTEYHICGVFDGEFQKMYINGVLQNDIKTPTGIFNTATNDFIVGKAPGFSESSFEKIVDDVMFFSRALTANEIKHLYNSSENNYLDSFRQFNPGLINFTGYVSDVNGEMNNTETRIVNISSATCLNTSRWSDDSGACNYEGDIYFNKTWIGQSIPFHAEFPNKYNQTGDNPLIIYLHGAGGNRTYPLDTSYYNYFKIRAKDEGYIIISPDYED